MIFFAFLLVYFIGYLTGYLNGKSKDIIQAIKETSQKLLPDKTIKPGIIHRPTAEDLIRRTEPEHIKAAREEMRKTLDNIPELVKAKEALKKVQNP